ncbi:hypothetical protein ACFFYR_08965 [Paraburkholderia dipogonis]|uniref:hypothetical protein n=1 Tax=Paraburkholderia dipogonis TaxID=1211383 RepID=UPI0035EE2B6D
MNGISCAAPTLHWMLKKFFPSRHCGQTRRGFLSPESLAAIANALLTSTLNRAPHLGPLVAGAHRREPASSLADGNGHFAGHTNGRRGRP